MNKVSDGYILKYEEVHGQVSDINRITFEYFHYFLKINFYTTQGCITSNLCSIITLDLVF